MGWQLNKLIPPNDTQTAPRKKTKIRAYHQTTVHLRKGANYEVQQTLQTQTHNRETSKTGFLRKNLYHFFVIAARLPHILLRLLTFYVLIDLYTRR